VVSWRLKVWRAPVKAKKSSAGSDEDAGIEMGQAQVFQELVGRRHDSYFLHKQMKIRRVRVDIFVLAAAQEY
jgi:hypothetical protein